MESIEYFCYAWTPVHTRIGKGSILRYTQSYNLNLLITQINTLLTSLISIIVGMQWWQTKHPQMHMFGVTGAHRGISACSGDHFPSPHLTAKFLLSLLLLIYQKIVYRVNKWFVVCKQRSLHCKQDSVHQQCPFNWGRMGLTRAHKNRGGGVTCQWVSEFKDLTWLVGENKGCC